MKCKCCQKNIDMFKPPFGAYFCKNNHLQCGACELNSSSCSKCGEDTKYKSPHFLSEETSSQKSANMYELQIPIVSDIEHTEEEEKEFRKLRLSFINGNADEITFLRSRNELNSVRTLSAIITKDLYCAKNNDKVQKTEAECHFRLEKIMRALRETGYPTDQQNNGTDENELDKNIDGKMDNNTCPELELLYPQQSQLRASTIKLTPSISSFSKIGFKSDTTFENELSDHTSFNKSENSSLNWADFKVVSRLNLIEPSPDGFPISIEAVSLDQLPFDCPISNCLGKFFISDFSQHIIHDHPTLPLTHLRFGQFRELFIDVKLCTYAPYGVACFLMCNIVKNFSTPPLNDILPMLLMTGRYRFNENTKSFSFKESTGPIEEPWTPLDFLIIWLVGIVPEQCEISVMISVFSTSNGSLSRWFVNHLNPIQNAVNIEDIFHSANRLLLTFREVQMLTNDFQNTLHCQVGLVNHVLKQIPGNK